MLKRAKKKNLETVPMTYEFMKILLKHRQIKKKISNHCCVEVYMKKVVFVSELNTDSNKDEEP